MSIYITLIFLAVILAFVLVMVATIVGASAKIEEEHQKEENLTTDEHR